MSIRTFIVAVVALGTCAETAACREVSVGGRSVSAEFSNPQVAQLARAACEGNERGVERALRAGADPNFEGLSGVTPLLWAINCENVDGIEALLRAGADPNHKVANHFSPTYAASTRWNPALLPVLLHYGGDPNAYYGDDPMEDCLSAALAVGIGGHGWENWRALLEGGADPERHDELRHTIATSAALLGQFDQVAQLLERGYDYDLQGLAYAVQMSQVDPVFADKVAARQRVIDMLEVHGIRFPVARPQPAEE